MKALTFEGLGKIEYSTVKDPILEQATDVLVRVQATAICGSDLHVYHEREKGIDPGTVMGHEAVGVVLEVGKDVLAFKKGDPVFIPFTTNCGKCFYCHSGLSARCVQGQLFGWVEKGRGLQGLQAELARIPLADSTLHKIPDGVSLEEALLMGDVFPTGFHCAIQAEVKATGTYAVVGCGPIGLMAIVAAKLLGAETVFAIERIPERMELAKKFGAIVSSPEEIMKSTMGMGVDGVLEAVGMQETERLAFDLVRPGGILSIVGVHTAPQFSFSPVEAYNKNLSFRTGRCPARSYSEKLLGLIGKVEPRISSIFTHYHSLSEGPLAYQQFDKKQEGCIKVLLRT